MAVEAPRGRRLRDFIVEHADGVFATLSVGCFSVIVGIMQMMKITDEIDEARKADQYLRSHELMAELKRERASYSNTVTDEKVMIQAYMEDDPAMKSRFEEWVNKYDKTYKDDLEKAKRFEIFKSFARFADACNADAARAGHSTRFGVNKFSDWNAQETAKLYGPPHLKDGGYFKMVLHYLVAQEMWLDVACA